MAVSVRCGSLSVVPVFFCWASLWAVPWSFGSTMPRLRVCRALSGAAWLSILLWFLPCVPMLLASWTVWWVAAAWLRVWARVSACLSRAMAGAMSPAGCSGVPAHVVMIMVVHA